MAVVVAHFYKVVKRDHFFWKPIQINNVISTYYLSYVKYENLGKQSTVCTSSEIIIGIHFHL